MSGSPVLADAAQIRPPSTGNLTEQALGAGATSVAEDLFAGVGDDVMHMWITINATQDFNYLMGTSAVGVPTNKAYFAAGQSVQFRANRSTLRYLRVTMPVAGDFLWWISGP